MKTTTKNNSTVENFKDALETCKLVKGLTEMAIVKVSNIYKNDLNAFANYINGLERDDKGNLLDTRKKAEIKAFQDVLAKQSTQRLAQDTSEDEKPEFKISFKMANKGLLNKGLCKIQQVDRKDYIWVVEEVKEPETKTFEEELEKLMKKHNVEGEFIKK